MPTHNFKKPAPAPPTTPRLRTPMKPVVKKDLATSTLIAFDDLMRDGSVFFPGSEKEFLKFVQSVKSLQRNFRSSEEERKRLKHGEQDWFKEREALKWQLKQAQQLLNQENAEKRYVEKEKENMQKQWSALQELVNNEPGHSRINNETLERIRKNYSPAPSIRVQRTASAKRNYYQPHNENQLEPLVETSAQSLCDASDLSFDDDSRDDILDGSKLHTGHIEKRRSSNIRKTATRRSHSMGADKIIGAATVATATVSLFPNGMIDAEARIETPHKKELKEMVKRRRESREQYKASAPPMDPPVSTTPAYTPGGVARTYSNATPASVQRTTSNAGSMPHRPHKFQDKKMYGNREKCGPCEKKIRIAKSYLRCQDCGLACHPECKKDVAVSCIRGITRTPNNKSGNFLADFVKDLERPMVPAVIGFCLEEIKERGLKEVGIYRISGAETESKELLEKIVYGNGPMPKLSKYDIHAITSCVKKFLRSLKEPIIHQSSWEVFVEAASTEDETEREAAMYQAISGLAIPNRDTLAYIILHLKCVADHKDKNKMDMDNLSKVMGPTIVGYSSSDPTAILSEAEDQRQVMQTLLNISDEYWKKLLDFQEPPLFGYKSTPETPAVFSPLTAHSANPKTGGPARRTRSRQHNTAKTTLFQSPMIY